MGVTDVEMAAGEVCWLAAEPWRLAPARASPVTQSGPRNDGNALVQPWWDLKWTFEIWV
jgi:hypothetical protein